MPNKVSASAVPVWWESEGAGNSSAFSLIFLIPFFFTVVSSMKEAQDKLTGDSFGHTVDEL